MEKEGKCTGPSCAKVINTLVGKCSLQTRAGCVLCVTHGAQTRRKDPLVGFRALCLLGKRKENKHRTYSPGRTRISFAQGDCENVEEGRGDVG